MTRECIILNTLAVQTRAFDWINLDSISSSVHHPHFSSISSDHTQSIHNSQSTKSYNESLIGIIDLHNIDSPHSFPVILTSRSTLAISPSEEDFVETIVPFQIERRLGGMTGDMHIEGI